MQLPDALALATTAGYAGLFMFAVRSTRRNAATAVDVVAPTSTPRGLTLGAAVATWLVVLIHLATLDLQTFEDGRLLFGFAGAASATLWIAIVIYSIEAMFEPIFAVRLLLFPTAAIASLCTLPFPGRPIEYTGGPLFAAHFVLALASYGVLLVAAVHAIVSLVADRALHNLGNRQGPPSLLVAYLPPLLSMERLLFRLIFAGFALLTLTLFSGLVFSDEIFGTPFRLDHKTVFSFLSWFIFAGLLYGRIRHGWRGRVALKYTLAGFVALLLAYIGTHFVLEVILRR